ncbi:DUF7108 domain-containing protein [Halapricum hydrolyticum]|uniref:RnhA operon protein n=1 Tax=Halapricum hydrolyticum TaxID=2979991 RepID=A0AAE3LFK0_9EURY|nr:rnhA operon protein [Halapricum hydrolyticum]MCU4718591.1 rnhA operon protein [Halapricum hydrolyticum]MCU4727560.1 rnhA operon protein [Halapricum hydrolyticum]
MTDLPDNVVEEAERLTRLARRASGEEAQAYRRDREEILAEYGYTARIREEDDTLVCHPEEWIDEEGLVRTERIEDLSRGVERPLSGPGEPEEWEAVASHNFEVADRVADEHGEPHGETARALAEFANNHYAKPIESLTEAELTEFREEYFPRNAWPSDDQREQLSLSIEYTVGEARQKEVPREGND